MGLGPNGQFTIKRGLMMWSASGTYSLGFATANPYLVGTHLMLPDFHTKTPSFRHSLSPEVSAICFKRSFLETGAQSW